MTAGAAHATQITLDGQTFNTAPAPTVIGTNGLTFLAQFTTSSQGLENKVTGGPHPKTTIGIIQLVEDYLATLGVDDVVFLGRAGDTEDLPAGDNGVTVTGAGLLTGTFTLNLAAGAPKYSAEFVAIHAGDGQSDNLFAINNPDPSKPLLTGAWATDNGHGLSNFDLFGTIKTARCTGDDNCCTGDDCGSSGGGGPKIPAPEPMSLALLSAGLLGLGLARWRRA
jgi:hypothetical protein